MHKANSDYGWVKTRLEDDVIQWKENTVEKSMMPDVGGMTLRDAIYLLENKGLKVKTEGHGRVVKQSIWPGSRIEEGELILIELS